MGRPNLTINDYEEQAALKGLKLIGKAPESVYDKATWECLNCGKRMRKTYRAVYFRDHGCRCSNGVGKKEVDYNQLASKLGIVWVKGTIFPSSTKIQTEWKTKHGRVFSASYYQMAHAIPKFIREIIADGADEKLVRTNELG
jgi:hypothetical protein